jgi:dienelactone hydrolase
LAEELLFLNQFKYMKHRLPTFLFAFILLQTLATAQTGIGHTTITFIDPARLNRPISTEIYYPAATTGTDVPCAANTYPVVVFGHGFVMETATYQNIWEALVPQGYIVCLPNTETSFSPSHSAFAADLSFLCTAMQTENTKAGSLFQQHVQPVCGLMGHSMGGGCAVLAAASGNPLIKCSATLAPAETIPSAKAAAATTTLPTLLFSATDDCITVPTVHQVPIYNAYPNATCKIMVSITDGSHCQFANMNTSCQFGEVFNGCANPSLSQANQHQIMFSLLNPFLASYLKSDQNAIDQLYVKLLSQQGFTSAYNCAQLTNENTPTTTSVRLMITPQPATDGYLRFDLQGTAPATELNCTIFDAFGRVVLTQRVAAYSSQSLDIKTLPKGTYALRVQADGRVLSQLFLVQ